MQNLVKPNKLKYDIKDILDSILNQNTIEVRT